MLCFNDCDSLVDIELPEELVIIEEYCFCNAGVQRINFPQSIREIENFAFFGCPQLSEIQFAQPSLLEKIADSAFSSTPLESVQSKFVEIVAQKTSGYVVINAQGKN